MYWLEWEQGQRRSLLTKVLPCPPQQAEPVSRVPPLLDRNWHDYPQTEAAHRAVMDSLVGFDMALTADLQETARSFVLEKEMLTWSMIGDFRS